MEDVLDGSLRNLEGPGESISKDNKISLPMLITSNVSSEVSQRVCEDI